MDPPVIVNILLACAISQAVSHWLPTAVTQVRDHPKPNVGFGEASATVGQIFSKYFSFPVHHLLHNLHLLLSMAGTVGPQTASVLENLVPLQAKRNILAEDVLTEQQLHL
jgi:hypothetical protein